MLDRKKKYLQIALNSTPQEGERIIASLPPSDRIIIEAGTPLIKEFGVDGIKRLRDAWWARVGGETVPLTDIATREFRSVQDVIGLFKSYYKLYHKNSVQTKLSANRILNTYIVADTKCMDRGKTEVEIAKRGGASAATVLGAAPIETINYFIDVCKGSGLDSMVDMIGVEQPIKILRKLRKLPTVVVLHRGVDEEAFDKNKPIPYVQINKIRSSFNVLISIAGGDTIRETQRAIFNDANIVVVWKNFYTPTANTGQLAREFLKEIK